MHTDQQREDPEYIEHLRKAADRLRWHSIEATSKAGSGHPTSCLSCAEIISVLFFEQMRLDLGNPYNPDNDRFVLSKGHAAPILWSVYYEMGIITKDELHSLRQIDSVIEGHPTPRHSWIDVATGSLGQGLAMALGMAWSAKKLRNESHTYVLLGDGETAEGSVWEAIALAPLLKTGNLTVIVDVNRYGQSQETMLGHDMNSYQQRFSAFGWKVLNIDGHDIGAVSDALTRARANTTQPVLILARTIKGKGVPAMEVDKSGHGKPAESVNEALGALDSTCLEEEGMLKPQVLQSTGTRAVPCIDEIKLKAAYAVGDSVAVRAAFGKALVELGSACKEVIALDGDVKNSTKLDEFFERYPDRSIQCYIAEQNMVGVAIGISKSGMIPCLATFSAFFSRAFDQLRMAAISKCRMIVAGTHVGVAIGEDGPSQMGLEDISLMRNLPGSLVLYPSDGTSTFAALQLAVHHEAISYLRLTRGSTANIYSPSETFEIGKAKVWHASIDDVATLIGGGVTLHECLKAQRILARQGVHVRVIDCFSIKPIDEELLRRAVLETGSVIVVEDHYAQGGLGEAVLSATAGLSFTWRHLCIHGLPRSGSPEALIDYFDISARAITKTVQELPKHWEELTNGDHHSK